MSTDKFKTYTNGNEAGLLEDYHPSEPLTGEEAAGLSDALDKKIRKSRKSIFKIISHLKALKKYMLDNNVQWYRKSVVVAALLYFIMPFDAMPDFAPILGYLDDIGVIAWTLRFLGREITGYYD